MRKLISSSSLIFELWTSLVQRRTTKVGASISVCDPLWTLEIKDIVDMKHMLHGLSQYKNQVQA
jgi:hypothetical protein